MAGFWYNAQVMRRRIPPALIATGTMLGYIVGVGLFGVPYVYVHGGVWWGVVITCLAGVVLTLLHVMFLQTLAASKERMRDVKMIGTYLGPWARRLAFVTAVLTTYGTLLAYTIAAGRFGATLLAPVATAVDPFWLSLVFFAFFTAIVLRGRAFMANVETIFTFLLILAVLVLLAFILPSVRPEHFTWLAPRGIFAVYGVALYALGGAAAVPTVFELLKPDHRAATRAVVRGTLIAMGITVAFGLVVAGGSGLRTTEESLTGLAAVVGPGIASVGAVFGLLGILTSFLPLTIYLRDVFLLDYKLPKPWAWALTLIPPLLLFLVGARSFIQVIGFTGGIVGGLGGMLIAASYLAARRKLGVGAAGIMRVPPFAAFLVILAFGAAFLVEATHIVLSVARG